MGLRQESMKVGYRKLNDKYKDLENAVWRPSSGRRLKLRNLAKSALLKSEVNSRGSVCISAEPFDTFAMIWKAC
jgi:hypothetical protein